jgi:hypothetical protein
MGLLIETPAPSETVVIADPEIETVPPDALNDACAAIFTLIPDRSSPVLARNFHVNFRLCDMLGKK